MRGFLQNLPGSPSVKSRAVVDEAVQKTPLIYRLPREILAEVFLKYIDIRGAERYHEEITPTDSKEHWICLYKSLPSPVILSQICSLWRYVMENTPALWTLLSISVVKPGQQLPDETLVTKWLSLSGVLPFEFVIDIEYDAKDGLKAPKSYLNVLLPYTDRLESIQLDFEFSYIKYFLDRPGLDLPNLKNVAIRFPWTELDDDMPLAALETAPSLQHLEYSSPDRDSTFLSRLVLPTSTITSLDITLGTDDPNVVRNIVVSCPKLEICQVEIPRYLDEVPDYVPVVLHRLETLSVIFSDPEGSPSFLDGLTLPALTTLCIGHYRDLDDDNEEPVGHFDLYPHLASLATRSAFALETFELQYTTEITYLEILAFIRSNPSIENLSITECDIEITSLCYGLTVTKDKPIGPNLIWIQLSQRTLSEGEDNSDVPNISRMVASRWRPCPTETELVVTANDEPTTGGEISFRVTHVPVKEPAEVRKLEEGVCLEFGFSLPEEVLSELWECEEEGMPLELEIDSSESEN